jgi:Xaa-Pro aminopeptidase
MRHLAARVLALVLLLAAIGAPSLALAQIPAAEYAARRDSLAARIGTGVVLAFGGRTPVVDFGPFRQLPAFRYLTNFEEADAAFVLVARGGRGQGMLFTTPINPRTAMYYGVRPDSAAIARAHGLPSRPFTALAATIDSLVAAGLPLWTLDDFEAADFAARDSLTRGRAFVAALRARRPTVAPKDAHPLVDALRARKSPAEVALLKRAAEISSAGHVAAMQLPDAQHEYDYQAVIEAAFLRGGASRPGYGSIVGAGINGTTLHYMKNRGPVRPGDMVVIDAGAEYEGYAADVTRTLPASGRFTAEQRDMYQLVLDAVKVAERMSGPGMSARAAADSSFELRARGLARLGLVESADATFDPPWRVNCERERNQCRQAMLWMIHGISHGIGLEVHDPAAFYVGERTFQPGDAFTIEPGIYITQQSLDRLPDTPKNRAFIAAVRAKVARYESMGFRIEDDYVVTPTGLERISTAPREVAEVEAAMRRTTPPGPTQRPVTP